jgi:Serine carboxypeptidase
LLLVLFLSITADGGPGASSLFGLLTELGPLLLNDLSLTTDGYKTTGIPTPIYNPYTWTRLGNILTFDQPAPIGFSYCNNSTDSHSCDGIRWNDEMTAQNALAALLAFHVQKFPCLGNDLYLTGESYGGIYIPTFAREILKYNSQFETTETTTTSTTTTTTTISHGQIPLKGFAVGDGCLGTETDICVSLSPRNPDGFDGWLIIFLAGHGQIPLSTLRETMHACRGTSSITSSTMTSNNKVEDYVTYLRTTQRNVDMEQSAECKAAIAKVHQQVGGVYDYGLYDECTYSNGLQQQSLLTSVSLDGAVNDYPCGGDIVMEKLYLALPVVQKALNLHSSWFSVDNAGLDFDYTPTEPDLTSFYQELVGVNTTYNSGIRILIYNGGKCIFNILYYFYSNIFFNFFFLLLPLSISQHL